MLGNCFVVGVVIYYFEQPGTTLLVTNIRFLYLFDSCISNFFHYKRHTADGGLSIQIHKNCPVVA